MSNIKYINLKPLKLKGGEIALQFPLISYGKQGSKIVYISDSVTGEDVHNKKLFASSMGDTISNIFDAAIKLENKLPRSIFVTTTHVAKRSSSLNDHDRGNNNAKIVRRIVDYIKKNKPDVVMFTSVEQFTTWYHQGLIKFTKEYKILNNPDKVQYFHLFTTRLLSVVINGYKCNAIITLSPRLIATSNPDYFKNTVQLIGFAVRDFQTAIRNNNKYNLPDAFEHTVIRDLKTFKKFFKQLLKCKTPSIDTETANLNKRYGNKLLVILFCLDGQKSWCLPWHHRDTPFTPKELNYIKKKLKWYFEYGKTVTSLYHTAKFDLHRIFTDLELGYYNHKIYDVVAGEFFLDENRKFLKQAKIPEGYTLQKFAAEYGGLGYFSTVIGKTDRANMERYSLEEISEYGQYDVAYPYHIARFQLKEAKLRGELYSGFFNAVAELGSDTTYVFTTMEHNGAQLDRKYFAQLLAPNSEVTTELAKAKDKFRDSKAVIKTNDKLLKQGNIPNGKGIFGTNNSTWVFDINKQKHQQALYFDILELDPVTYKKDGGGKLGKPFIAEYEATVPEVAMLSNYTKLKQLKATYLDGIWKIINKTADGIDFRLRSSYLFTDILTTRAASRAPNLQNIPSRGKFAKLIKRMFIACEGYILVKLDFSSHEVRMWCNIGKDYNLANSFAQGMILRRKLRIMRIKDHELDKALSEWQEENKNIWKDKKTPFDKKVELVEKLHNQKELYTAAKILLELEIKGDSHRLNYEFFFGKPAAEVDDDERQSIKQVVFGVIYGKMALALARDIYKAVAEIDRKFRRKYIGVDPESEEYDKIKHKHNIALKPFKDQAQNLRDTLFTKFKAGGDWLKQVSKDAAKDYRAVSIFGAVRHLWGFLHHDNGVKSMADRRTGNSLIQGPSSNIGFTGAKLMLDKVWELKQYGINIYYLHTNSVHDSVESEIKLKTLPIMLYYLEHSMTTLVHKKLLETYNQELIVGLEIDMEIGGSLAHMTKWDTSSAALFDIVDKEIDWMQKELGHNLDKKSIMKAVKHNQRIIEKYRLEELEQQKDSFAPSTYLAMTPKRASKEKWILND